MHPLCNGAQALRTVIHCVHGRHHSEQALGRANVGGRLVAANVLLAGLKGHAQGGLAQAVFGDTDDSAWEVALQAFTRRKKGGVRSTVAHGNPKPLGAAHHHVGAHGTGAFQNQQGHQIGGKHSADLALRHASHKPGQVLHLAIGIGVLDQTSKDIVGFHRAAHLLTGHHGQVDVEMRGAGAQDTQRLRIDRLVDQESILARLHLGTGSRRKEHRHGLCCSRAFVEQGCVGHFHAREVHDHGLEVEQRFKAALGDFRLIRRVSRVPSRVFKDVATNHAGHFGGIIAHADVVAEDGVLGREAVDVLKVLAFRQGFRHTQTFAQPDGSGNGAFDEVVKGGCAEGAEHGILVFHAGTQMAGNKTSNLHENQKNVAFNGS